MKKVLLATTVALGMMTSAALADPVVVAQTNNTTLTGASNTGDVVGGGVQLNVLAGIVEQDVEAVGAVNSVNQKNIGTDATEEVAVAIDYGVSPTGQSGAPWQGGGDFEDSASWTSFKNDGPAETFTAKDGGGNVLTTVDVPANFWGALPTPELDGESNVTWYNEAGDALPGSGSYLSGGSATPGPNDTIVFESVPAVLYEQTNISVGNTSVNTGDVYGGGIQVNLGVNRADQSVGGFGSQQSTTQLNRDGDTQGNLSMGNVAGNTGEVKSRALQVTVGARSADQSVISVGSGQFSDQTNRSGNVQTNAAMGNVAANEGDVQSLGVQGNLFVRNADQGVNATGAAVGTTQMNRAGSTQTNLSLGNAAGNTADVSAIGIQGNALVRNASQSVGAVGASVGTVQTNR